MHFFSAVFCASFPTKVNCWYSCLHCTRDSSSTGIWWQGKALRPIPLSRVKSAYPWLFIPHIFLELSSELCGCYIFPACRCMVMRCNLICNVGWSLSIRGSTRATRLSKDDTSNVFQLFLLFHSSSSTTLLYSLSFKLWLCICLLLHWF